MPDFQLERTIRRPVDDVFAFVSDFRNAPQWQSGIVSLRVEPDGPAQRGTVVSERRRIQGHDLALTYRVVDLEPGTRIAVQSTEGPVGYSAVHTLTATEDGATRVRFGLEVRLSGGMRFLAGLVAPAVRRQAEADLDRLTELLERRA